LGKTEEYAKRGGGRRGQRKKDRATRPNQCDRFEGPKRNRGERLTRIVFPEAMTEKGDQPKNLLTRHRVMGAKTLGKDRQQGEGHCPGPRAGKRAEDMSHQWHGNRWGAKLNYERTQWSSQKKGCVWSEMRSPAGPRVKRGKV